MQDLMTPIEDLMVVSPDADLVHVLGEMARTNMYQVLVIEEGKILGLVTRARILALLEAHK